MDEGLNLSGPCIRRPIGTTLVTLALVGVGILAYFSLAVAPLPRVDMPTLMVSASLPGASPETMASSVAAPLERRFGRIAGLSEMTSSSALGTTSVVLQFNLERDVDAAGRDVQAAINAAAGDLPANLPMLPTYRRMNPADAPVMLLSLTSHSMSLGHLFDLASNVLAQKMSQLDGIGQVSVGGGQQPAIRVRAHPGKLASRGLTFADVRAALLRANATLPKGLISNDSTSFVIALDDQMNHASAYAKLIIAWHEEKPVRLGDVAEVVADVENTRTAGWADNERSIVMIVRRQPEANILATIDKVLKLLPELKRSLPEDAELKVINDRSATIRSSVRDVEYTLLITLVLVFGVVWAFLKDLRATLIPCTAVPISLITTFIGMKALGYSLDNLSLMALTIATGFVVDDAIVVTENITRLMHAGLKPKDAALKGARQIGFTIVSITVSLLAVFIPMLLMEGILGRLFREFSVTLSIAVGLSAIVSLTITPMMCAYLLRATPLQKTDAQEQDRPHRLITFYKNTLMVALRYPWAMASLTAFAVGLSIVLFTMIPKGLVPQQDTGMLMGFTEGPQDISFESMKERQAAVGALVLKDPDVAHVLSFCGAGMGGPENTGTMFVVLKDSVSRKTSADGVIARLRPQVQKFAGINLFLQAVQDVRMGGRAARTQYQFAVQSSNLSELRHWAPKLQEAFAKLPELRDVNSDMQSAGLEMFIRIDRDEASRLGVGVRDIDDALYDAFGQRQVATLFGERSQYRVVLEMDPKQARSLDALDAIYVSGAGGPVPLSQVVAREHRPVALSVNHQGQFAATTLSFNLKKGVALSDAVVAIERAQQKIKLPQTVQADFSGVAQAFGSATNKQPMLIVMALLAVYVVLGVLYESTIHPLTILSTLPSAGVGALVALFCTRHELSIMAFVAMILLVGIVKKNAIMMVDVALEEQRNHHMSAYDAIVHASLLRVRPIVMTTLAALFGGLPMALGQGPGSELRRPLGIAIVGGLLMSQILTLYTTPAIYLLLDRARRKVRPHSSS